MSVVALALMSLPMLANASCDAVKSDIDAKIKAKGVNNYSLEVVPADQADKSGGKVVGHCEGTNVIVYTRGESKSNDDSSGTTPAAPPPTRPGQAGG
jgi:hypothetical protein